METGRTAAEGEGQITQMLYDGENRLIEIQRKTDAGAFATYQTYKYIYVENDPISFVDYQGLVRWKGTLTGLGYVKGAGAAGYRFEFTSECKCGEQVTIEGYISTLAAGLGVKLAASISSLGLYDYNECPETNVANGDTGIFSFGGVIGAGGACTKATIGKLFSDFQCGPSFGFDISGAVYGGASVVTDYDRKCCS